MSVVASGVAIVALAGTGAFATTHPALVATTMAAVSSAVSCSTSAACVSGSNTSSGVGVAGTSAKGYGVTGTSTSFRGVEGTSTSADGVGGVTTSGTAGVYGQNASKAGYGVEGNDTATSGTPYGVFGKTASSAYAGAGVYGSGLNGVLALGNATLSDASGATFGDGTPAGVFAISASTNTSGGSYGIVAESDSYPVMAENTGNGAYASLITTAYLLQAYSDQGGDEFITVDRGGNETLSGSMTANGGYNVRQQGSSGASVLAYSARTTMPQLEDVGEGRLINGGAKVAIDPQLADVIDRRTAYHVFITPEGDCNGLYVSEKTPGGFTVRELRGGRSSLAFEYRIVAKPVNDNGRRLPAAPPRPKPEAFLTRNLQHR